MEWKMILEEKIYFDEIGYRKVEIKNRMNEDKCGMT